MLENADDWKTELASFLLQKFKDSDKNAIEDCISGQLQEYVYKLKLLKLL